MLRRGPELPHLDATRSPRTDARGVVRAPRASSPPSQLLSSARSPTRRSAAARALLAKAGRKGSRTAYDKLVGDAPTGSTDRGRTHRCSCRCRPRRGRVDPDDVYEFLTSTCSAGTRRRCPPPGATSCTSSRRSTRRARSWASARSARGASSCSCSDATWRPVLPPGEGGRPPRSSRRTSARPSTRRPGTASSPASSSPRRPRTRSSAGSTPPTRPARERHFYVRQLYDGKASADVSTIDAAHAAGLRGDLRLDAGPRPRTVR